MELASFNDGETKPRLARSGNTGVHELRKDAAAAVGVGGDDEDGVLPLLVVAGGLAPAVGTVA